MSKLEFKVHFIYDNKGHRVELGYPEIQTLLFLNEHNFLSQPQLYTFYSFVCSVHPATFRKKTGKWLEAGIIKKRSLSLQNGHSVVIISLAGAGLTILKKLGYIEENIKLKSLSLNNIDHSLAIKQVVLDVISNYRVLTNAQIYHVKGLYLIGIQPNVFFETISEPVIIYKTRHLGEDKVGHFKKYDGTSSTPITMVLTSINPYKEKDEYTEVIADWLFEMQGHFLHIEVDCGNEQIRKSKSKNDTSFEGKLSRLQPQLEKKEIVSSNYHVLFVMVDNRKDAVLTRIHPNRATRIANVKQEITCFSEFNQWQFEISVIQFSRVDDFLLKYFMKIVKPNADENDLLIQLYTAFNQKKDLQFQDWDLKYITKDFILEGNYFPRDGYIPEITLVYVNKKTSSVQILIPFFMEEGSVKKSEQLAILAEHLSNGLYNNYYTKALVIYPDHNQLQYDILRKTKKNSKDSNAMDTTKMLFLSLENFTRQYDTPKLFNESKKIVPYNSIFELIV